MAMSVCDLIAKVVSFLRPGYPQGVPATDTFPLLGLLHRRLSDEEVVQVARELVERGDSSAQAVEIGVMITKITHQTPSAEEVERVKDHLKVRGWPISDEFPSAGGQ
jgi:hypothetical protein